NEFLPKLITLLKRISFLTRVCKGPVAAQYFVSDVQLRVFLFQKQWEKKVPIHERRVYERRRRYVCFDGGGENANIKIRKKFYIQTRKCRFLRVQIECNIAVPLYYPVIRPCDLCGLRCT